jgi:hypothetical protein
MTLATPHVPTKRKGVTVSDSALSMGTVIPAGKGAGKTTLLGELSAQVFQKGYPQVLFDPLGTLTPAFLFRTVCFLQHVPPDQHRRFWEKIRYVDLGAQDRVTPFPIYYHSGTEHSLREVAVRFLNVLRMSSPELVKNAPISWPQMRRLGINTGMILTSLSYQLTEAEDLLFNTLAWEKSGRFDEAVRRNPEAAPAVSYFRNHFIPLPRSEKSHRTSLFLDHVFDFYLDPQLRAVFCASTPGINWQDVEETGQTVLLDFRNIGDPVIKRFAMLWVFATLYEFLKQRGRKDFPFAVTIDEFAALAQQVNDGTNPLAVTLDELINQYMRNNNIWFTCAFQSIFQLDEQLRNTVLSLGTYVFGRTATMREARILADALFYRDPYQVKHYQKVWGKDSPAAHAGFRRDGSDYFVLDYEPEFLGLDDQLELAAKKINQLRLFEFLLRPAIREGEVSQAVLPLSIKSLVADTETGEYVFPDRTLVDRLRSGLAARSGIPAATIRKEQEARLPARTIQKPGTEQTVLTPNVLPAAESWDGNGKQPFRSEHGAHPKPHTRRETQPHPSLDEHQRALLAFLIEHPDMSVSSVYKGLGMSVRKGNEIRDSLKEQGFLLELELRSGKAGAGRPMKCIIPSFQAFEQLGIAPPKGRGSVIHRQLQQIVAEGAGAKGYSTQVEKILDTGTIVDVHLEKGQERIAVEIAIASWPELEIAHIKHCISFGYEKVFGIFADENLLARTAQLIEEAFSADVAGRIRLLPVSKISQLGR